MKKLLTIIYSLAILPVSAQFLDLNIDQRLINSPEGIYVSILPEQFASGSSPESAMHPFENHQTLQIERLGETPKTWLVRPIQSSEELNEIFGEDISTKLIESETFKSITNEASLVKYFSKPDSTVGLLLMNSLKTFRALGLVFLDENVKLGENYTYKVKWADESKLLFEENITYTSESTALKNVKFNFSKQHLLTSEASVGGSWYYLGTTNKELVKGFNVYGKKSGHKNFKLLLHSDIDSANDSLKAEFMYNVRRNEVWDVFVRPTDGLGNEGISSDTASLLAFKISMLPFIDNLETQDTTSGTFITWNPVKDHSYVSGILVSREGPDGKMHILDTLSLYATSYFDRNVIDYDYVNYQFQCLPAPIQNLMPADFVSTRIAAHHENTFRELPPTQVRAAYEGDSIFIRWKPVENFDKILQYFVYSSTNGVDFTIIGKANPLDSVMVDSLRYGDFSYATRTYAIKSFSKTLRLSEYSNSFSLKPRLQKTISAPYAVKSRILNNGLKIEWEIDDHQLKFIRGYRVQRISETGDSLLLPSDSTLLEEKEFFDNEMENGQNYTYQIVAIDIDGRESALSDALPASWKPEKVLNKTKPFYRVFYRSLPKNQIEISWDIPVNKDVAKVRIYRKLNNSENDKWRLIGEANASDISFRDQETTAGTSYAYVVSAIDSAGKESEKYFYQTLTASNLMIENQD